MPRHPQPAPAPRTRHTLPVPGPKGPATFRFTDFAMI